MLAFGRHGGLAGGIGFPDYPSSGRVGGPFAVRPLLCASALLFACGEPPIAATPEPAPEVSGGEAVAGPTCRAPEAASAEELRARIAALPDCDTLRIALANRLAVDGECDGAEEELDPLVAQPAPDARHAFIRLAAGSCGDRRRVELASVYCASMLANDPENPATWLACGRLQESQGETARAMECYGRALELDPTALEAMAAPASLALRFRDFPVAARHFGRLTDAAPDRADGWRGLAHARRGTGDLAGAITAMERAVALDGAAAEPRYHLALWLRESGAYEPAVVQLRAFLVVAADEPALTSARERARKTLERWRRDPAER